MSDLDLSFVAALQGVSADSRNVKPGFLFAALPGAHVDGRDFIDDAVSKGATAILVSKGTRVPAHVRCIEVDNVRRAFALITAAFYNAQPEMVVAVTGTNGKTSVAHFVRQIWQGLGKQVNSLGTLDGALTTPDPVVLHARLAEMDASGVTHCVMEASSHGLDQYRMDGVDINIAAFTNLSRDHLDYHGDMEAYFAAKARLFSDLLRTDGVAVLNADDGYYETLKELAKMRGCSVVSYGMKGADITLKYCAAHPEGQAVTLIVFGEEVTFDLPLLGDFQVMNILCAIGIILARAQAWTPRLKKILATLSGVPGRVQRVGAWPVYIDFAHTPDALESVLKAMRAHTNGRLMVVFGCGGDRDAGKRTQMGLVAARLADQVFVTDDNPRSEDPASIRAAIMGGGPNAIEVAGRDLAIKRAINDMRDGDVLIIAGKGHEQGQIVGDAVIAFDDYDVARAALVELEAALKNKNTNTKQAIKEECVS